jgi:D-alanyl-D-alanine carboxypeptidase
MLCALDYFTDIHETITVKTVDITSGSGSTFYDGDKLEFWDAVRIMMMESSNTLATCIGRCTGEKILLAQSGNG